MDYIYSKLSESVEKVEYSGATTTTAVVTVDNNNNVISVDVRELSPDILNVAKPAVNGNYALMQKVSANGVTTYSWVSADQVSQPLLDEIERAKSAEAAIAGGINQEINDRIAADNAINNSISDLTGRVSAVESMSQRVDGVIAQTAKLEAQLATESSERQKQDEELSNGIAGTQSRITNLDKEFQEKHNILNTKVNNEIADRENADSELLKNLQNESYARETTDKELSDKINSLDTNFTEALSNESTRVDNMINQLNDNVSSSINQLNQNLVDAINTINGGIATEIEERKSQDDYIFQTLNQNLQNESSAREQADNSLQNQISGEANNRASVDQHLWDILPDNIISGTPMQGMENKNAVNIVFSKYQKHGIGEDPADAELVEVPNQAITLFPATQEVAGVLTAADKTKIDNIATDIETAVQAEAEARQSSDTEIENKLDSLIVVEGAAIQVGDEEHELNIKTGGRFTVNSNYEVVTSEEYPGEPGRRIIPLENNDQIAGKKTDGNGVPLIFVSKWDKVEVGGSGAPLNLNSDSGKVTVNDEHTLLDETDKQELSETITSATDAVHDELNTFKSNANTFYVVATNAKLDIIPDDTTAQLTFSIDTQNPSANATSTVSTSVAMPIATNSAVGMMSANHVNRLNDSVLKNGDDFGIETQTIQGNIVITGNLEVNGTTTSNDTETLVVQDNLIVTNGGGAELTTSMSGLGIKTNATNAFGVVYDPSVSELKAGIGVVSESNAFSFNEGEGNPVALRSSDDLITDGNVLRWDGTGRKLVDSGVPYAQIARKDSEQSFIGTQTFVNVNATDVVATNLTTTSFVLNGVALQSNVAGIVAVESQVDDKISTAITSLVDNASENYDTLGEIETQVLSVNSALQSEISRASGCESAINTDLQDHKTTATERFEQVEANITSINNNCIQMNANIAIAQTCASNAYTQANIANNTATNANTAITNHMGYTNNPHGVTASQLSDMHQVNINIFGSSAGTVFAPTTQSADINVTTPYTANITFYDKTIGAKTIHVVVADEESAGDYEIGINDGTL